MRDLKSFLLLMYEYLYNKGNRLEHDYLTQIDNCYKVMFSHRPERYLDSYDMLKVIESKAKFDSYMEIQAELYQLLSCYKDVLQSDNPNK